MTSDARLSLEEVRELARAVLLRHGLAPAHVNAVSESIVAGERDGCASHGLYRLLGAVHSLRAGKVASDAIPTVRDQTPVLVCVDAQGGFAQLAFDVGRPILAARARRYGMAALAINNCAHFAALWPEVEALATDGLVAIACTPSHAWVAPFGGIEPILGTNPIAFGWPRPQGHPFVFDFATSAVARGEIELHRRAGKPIPPGWGLDPEGQATTSASEALAGSMLTFGGHKGSALSIMVELLAGPLIGDMTSVESLAVDAGAGAAPLGGEFILAIDPDAFLGARALVNMARAEQLFRRVIDSGARLPSQRRYEARARSLRDGVLISKELLDDIKALLGN